MDDLLALLLPDVPQAKRPRAGRLATPHPAERVSLPLARRELLAVSRTRLLAAVESLLRHLLGRRTPRGGALWFGRPAHSQAQAWRELERASGRDLFDLRLPLPGEGLAALGSRLLDLAHRLAPGWQGQLLWRWRCELLEALAAGELLAPEQPSCAEQCCDHAAAALDLGEPRAAWRVLRGLRRPTPRARQLHAWCQLSLGLARPEEVCAEAKGPGPLSLAAARLVEGTRPARRDRERDACAQHPGRAAPPPLAGSARASLRVSTHALSGHGISRAARDGEGALVQELLRSACIVRGDRVALVPCSAGSELVGWVRLGFGHRYLPLDEELQRQADGVLRGLGVDRLIGEGEPVRDVDRSPQVVESLQPGLRLVRGLGLQPGLHLERRGVMSDIDLGEAGIGPVVPLGLLRRALHGRSTVVDRPGGCAVVPLLLEGHVLVLLSLCERDGHGAPRSMARGGHEAAPGGADPGARHGDGSGPEACWLTGAVRRVEESLHRLAMGVSWALLADERSLERGGGPVVPPVPGSPMAAACRAALRATGEGQGLVLRGPAGSGRRTLVQWLVRLSGHRLLPGASDAWQALASGEPPEGRCLYLLPALERPTTEQLAALRLAARRRGTVVVAVCEEEELAASLARKGLRHIAVPGLDERRAELPELVLRWLQQRLGVAGALYPVEPRGEPDGELAALLFRSCFTEGWTGLLPVLEKMVAIGRSTREGSGESSAGENTAGGKLADGNLADGNTGDGEVLPAADLLRLALQGAGLPAAPRLTPRHTPAGVVEAALRRTCTAGGRWNRSRAASLLGWDRETLTRRLRTLDIQPDA